MPGEIVEVKTKRQEEIDAKHGHFFDEIQTASVVYTKAGLKIYYAFRSCEGIQEEEILGKLSRELHG